ncbi:dihydroxyacetone kinase family protein [Arthrobacter agilis]|uniref:dihydroxyacetone kinase family protein n=1 Tax=Arthrobacter agilis TaxID=37921 RepID=UPI000B351ACE|nr:dihydroxyacetone kinase family protein [Arthrobacter agilis]OUM43558.1 D-erythrulose kinase [Arthrobacter agilis]PPB47633.1 DAK2 domain-containing protein [Arthrobacter agilis]TPV24805.1 dihydroxyacetone kinase family protein [Arthrobacter agilis]VDR30947.1 Dihydroxyacetone kinase [Arthrobacter agilis]
MTYLVNDPEQFATDALRGYAAAHPEHVVLAHGGVVRSTETPQGQPALVIGGGSGHYPAFAGWIGPGMGHGAPCGNIFSSPSASQVYSVSRSAENGGGVILGFGNYAGDVLHFGQAAEKLRAEGVDVRIIRVSDDIASGPAEDHRDRRGVAGDLVVFKIAGAAIEAGADIDEAERVAWKANDATRSFGVAFEGCTLPGADGALFHVPDGEMAIGLGIHGEPGIREVPLGTGSEVADLLLDGVLEEEPERSDGGYQGRVGVVLNGLGSVKYEELFLAYGRLAERFAEKGLTVVAPEVGEHVTSLDMAGLSLTVVFLDDELEQFWLAPADTPAFRRGAPDSTERTQRTSVHTPGEEAIPESSPESREVAQSIVEALEVLRATASEHQEYFGKLDAVAGDGDHGQGMAFGTRGAAEAARAALDKGAGARTVLLHAGDAWAEEAGGTSGALWGAALTAAGSVFDDARGTTPDDVVRALLTGTDAIRRLGGAEPGDKTMVDAIVPFREALETEFQASSDAAESTGRAAAVAREAADATADITARLGRSRVLGEKSVGTPDPGAISFSLLMAALADHFGAAGAKQQP